MVLSAKSLAARAFVCALVILHAGVGCGAMRGMSYDALKASHQLWADMQQVSSGSTSLDPHVSIRPTAIDHFGAVRTYVYACT